MSPSERNKVQAALSFTDALSGNPDPLSGNQDPQYWRSEALECWALYKKALTCDLRTRAQMREKHERESLAALRSSSGSSPPFVWSLDVLTKPRRRGRPSKLPGILALRGLETKQRGRPKKWMPEKRVTILDVVNNWRHTDPAYAKATDKKIIEGVLQKLLGRNLRRGEFNHVQIYQTQLSLARRESAL